MKSYYLLNKYMLSLTSQTFLVLFCSSGCDDYRMPVDIFRLTIRWPDPKEWNLYEVL